VLMYERLRLLTFDERWKKFESPLLSPENFAKLGFVFKDPPDRVQCVFCLIILEKWEVTDDPEKEHIKYSPNCGWRRKHNISIEEEDFDNNILREYDQRLKTFEPPFSRGFSFFRALFHIENASFFAKNGFFLHKCGYLQCVYCKIIIGDELFHN
ncbi:baculoviral IAP repeat-containing protein, partial [Klebsiella pneumoniae]|uniref:baculoviral IAP repeat-containing protein n=1 Tax=Klebsiella pneumoniae TaxID=573 RepID=UPI002003E1F4